MGAGMNIAQLADVHLGINLGRLKAVVPEQLLDVPDVRAVFQHVGGATVAK
jgi:hypothetical protein